MRQAWIGRGSRGERCNYWSCNVTECMGETIKVPFWYRAEPLEHVKNGSKQYLSSFLSNIDFFSGRFRNVILFRIYQYLISHKKSRIRHKSACIGLV